MSAIAFLQELLDAGLPLEAAMTAARIHEERMMSAQPTPSSGAERTRRWRERKASQSVTERHETSQVTDGDAPSFPLSPSPQTPQPLTPIHPDITPRPRKGPSRAEIATGFLTFWTVYPKKVGKDAAARAFSKAMARIDDAEPLAVILAGVERALPGWDKPRFIPHPSTWLNEGRWDDEAPEPAKPAAPRARNDPQRPDRRTAQLDHYQRVFAAMGSTDDGTVERDRADRYEPGDEGGLRALPPAA